MIKRKFSATRNILVPQTPKRQRCKVRRVSFMQEPSIVTIEDVKASIMTESEKRTTWYRPDELGAIKNEAWLLCQNAIQRILGDGVSVECALPNLPPIDFTPVADQEEFRGLERYLNFERQRRKSAVKKAVLNLQQLLRENQPIISTIGSFDTVSASVLANKTSDYTAWARNVALRIGLQDHNAAYVLRPESNALKGEVDGCFLQTNRQLVM
mmetsp:Transcript_7032/g.9519  ORF Transcript_7032/g.9519 Transcript_7032/m.9519 type:complete len:212 (-) Transcript_7032:1-636(-)